MAKRQFRVMITGRLGEVTRDLCEHMERDRQYAAAECPPKKSALLKATLERAPQVIIICLRGETPKTVRVFDILAETAPDPTTDVGVPGAQAYILEHVPGWIEKYGAKSAYFCTNDAHTEPLIKKLLECGGYFIEADLPSPLMGYPGALDLDLTEAGGDFEKILATVEDAVVERGGAGRFGTWAYSYGYTVSVGLAEHARNVILGESRLTDVNDLSRAYGVFSPGSKWNGAWYTDAETGAERGNTLLIYQDTYIFGSPGYYVGTTEVEVPGKYFTVR